MEDVDSSSYFAEASATSEGLASGVLEHRLDVVGALFRRRLTPLALLFPYGEQAADFRAGWLSWTS